MKENMDAEFLRELTSDMCQPVMCVKHPQHALWGLGEDP